MDAINLFDAFGAAWLLAHILLGWHYGFARQVATSGAIVGGFIVAHQFCTEVSAWFTSSFDLTLPLQHILCFLCLVGIGYALASLLLYPFRKLIEAKESPLSTPNRIMGGVSSGIVATIMIYTLMSSLTWVNERFEGKIAEWMSDYDQSHLVSFVEDNNAFDFLRLHEQSLLRIVATGSISTDEIPGNEQDSSPSLFNEASIEALMGSAQEYLNDHILQLIRTQSWSELFNREEVVLFLESHPASIAIARNNGLLSGP